MNYYNIPYYNNNKNVPVKRPHENRNSKYFNNKKFKLDNNIRQLEIWKNNDPRNLCSIRKWINNKNFKSFPRVTYNSIYKQANTQETETNYTVDDEILKIINETSIPENIVNDTILKIKNDLKIAFINIRTPYEMHIFGSCLNGLRCRSSDTDIYLKCEDKLFPKKVRKNLYRSRFFKKIVYIGSTRVPVLKCVHVPTGKPCDLVFSNEVGVQNSLLTKFYLNLNKNLKPLILFVKYLLQKYNLHGTGKITTYMLFWLVVFYMQQKELLPSVLKVRKSSKNDMFISGWNCSVPEYLNFTSNDTSNLFMHLKEFLSFYSNFEFLKFVICPYTGTRIAVNDFDSLNIPVTIFSTYLRKVENESDFKFSCNFINLQDPSEFNVNITKPVDLNSANNFRLFCTTLYDILLKNEETIKFKKSIMNIVPRTISKKIHVPNDCSQFMCTSYSLDYFLPNINSSEKDCYKYFKNIFCNTMDYVLNFNVKSIFLEDVKKLSLKKETLIKCSTSMGYLECYSETDKYNSLTISEELILEEKTNYEATYDPLTAFIILESFEDHGNKKVRIIMESKMKFLKFLQNNLLKLLKFTKIGLEKGILK